MERRSLLDGDATPARGTEDIFGDEFEVDDFDIVADGFRPSDHDREGSVRRSVEADDYPTQRQRSSVRRTGSSATARDVSRPVSPVTSVPRSRNSIRKRARSSMEENPFASPDDDGRPRTPSMTFEPEMAAHRSVSSASSHQFARTGSPRFVAGPSHPYGMYPQGTMPRSSSGATASNSRQPHRSLSLRDGGGPQHPYSLYPQGVGEDDQDEDDALAQNPVPVGFIGLGQSYQRRLGPDGEEQDIIGEDGHTEQLPPYTRYPEDGPEKAPLLGVPAPPTALHSRAPVAGTDPTMDLMHTPLLPQPVTTAAPQSMTDASILARQPSVRALGDAESHEGSSNLDKDYMKKSWREKSWKEKRKTRFCGIPFWWYLLSFCVIAFIVAVLGGVIGGFVQHQQHSNGLALHSTSLYDAIAIATPASPAPPTGTYSLSLSTPQQIQSQCLTEADQQAAWSCDLAGEPDSIAINVGIPPGGNQSGAYIYYNSNEDEICYGAQMSWMESTYTPFTTVQDNDSPSSGPAYYFQQLYNKLVVIPENALTVPPTNNDANGNTKRQAIQLDQAWLQRKQVAQPGEKPWFCVWNNTLMEAFVYVQQPVAPSYQFSTASSNASSSTTTSPPDTSSTAGTTATAAAATSLTASSAMTSMTTTYTESSTTATATFTGPASNYAAFLSNIAAAQQTSQPSSDPNNDNDNDSNNIPSSTPKSKSKRQVAGTDDLLQSLSLYPYVVKVEERRLSGNTIQPYCQQYQILDDGTYNWVPQANGQPIIVELEESDPSYSAYQNANEVNTKSKRRKLREEKRLVSGGCHCQWISGQSA